MFLEWVSRLASACWGEWELDRTALACVAKAEEGSRASVPGESTGLAGLFRGSVQVTGSVFKGGGGFRIDHPLDPANKYLSHSFVESSDMKNVYDGVVTLDSDGQRTVELPQWVGTLNKDFRYQLTPIGAPAPTRHIAAEISTNRFTIAGGAPGMKVSWQVTGIRRDAWAQANPVTVEVDKPSHERGFYLHPDLYGQPPANDTFWKGDAESMRQLEGDELLGTENLTEQMRYLRNKLDGG